MVNLADLFRSIQAGKRGYLQSNSGRDFENRIRTQIDTLGYSRVLPTDIGTDEMLRVKQAIRDRLRVDPVINQTAYAQHYIMQPFGSQDYPDFIVMDGDRLIGIEVKYSSGRQSKPVWNGGLPRLGGIYIFGASGLADITFFTGYDVLNAGDIKKLQNFFADLTDQQEAFNAAEMGGQAYGFSVYSRAAFNQSQKHNSDAAINFFTNPNRADLEASVIGYVERS